ncbi:MAG: VWA domain-containing protein [Anaerolineae bacterium]|nr:VWA domain-containing protein [Thermoflexus sp.]MDW8064443.1 VWA domain-containing protein [Anaerolineae bacterium]
MIRRPGQVIVLFALMLVVLLAFTGLALDGARIYMARNRLQHALDGAALAAANQFRIGRTMAHIRRAAEDFLSAQGFDVASVRVYTCDSPGPYESELCTNPRRKLVWVEAAINVPMTFMQLLGWNVVPVSAATTGEAASVDLVLIIDSSESMAYDTPMVLASSNPVICIPTDSPNPNPACPRPQRPHFCNPGDRCVPMRQVRQAALNFAEQMYYPYDRVAVVSFDRQARLHVDLNSGNSLQSVRDAILGIQVYDQSLFPDTAVCAGMYCSQGNCQPVPQRVPGLGVDPRPCPSSNVAGALRLAYNVLATQGRRDEQGALWAIVMLSDASPNATDPMEGLPYGLCPRYFSNPISLDPTWYWGDPSYRPFCQDGNFEQRHLSNSNRYDAEDAALDMLDLLRDARVVVFSIGYGTLMHDLNVLPGEGRDRDLGEKFMRYTADYTDGDNQAACLQSGTNWFDPGAVWKPQGVSCSNYFYAPNPSALQEIFREIARRIFTRISR